MSWYFASKLLYALGLVLLGVSMSSLYWSAKFLKLSNKVAAFKIRVRESNLDHSTTGDGV